MRLGLAMVRLGFGDGEECEGLLVQFGVGIGVGWSHRRFGVGFGVFYLQR